jgi:hypothetical protein
MLAVTADEEPDELDVFPDVWFLRGFFLRAASAEFPEEEDLAV